MAALMRSVSGIRGIVGDGLDPIVTARHVNAFLRLTKARRVVVGRDTRTTGPMMEQVVLGCCSAAGVHAVSLGVASTPTVEMMVPRLKAGAGIIITASHNPAPWNALKFLDHRGLFLDEAQVAELFRLTDATEPTWADHRRLGALEAFAGADEYHLQQVLALPCLDVRAIRKRKFQVAFDGVNGAGSGIVPALLKRLGCTVHTIHATPDGNFPHGAEPVPGNLRDLCRLVKSKRCDLGIATDPDADRCALIDERGRAIGEEYTLVFASRLVLARKKGPVTINLSTSRMIEDVAAARGVPVFRAKVGEINVTSAMRENRSVIGGEGNGGVIYPALHYGRDGILAAAMTLQLLTEAGRPVSSLVADFPSYHIEKQKFPTGGRAAGEALAAVRPLFPGAEVDERDGLRLGWKDRWVHVRASNTEPVLRVIAEAPGPADARALCALVAAALK